MSNKINFKIATPERVVFKDEVDSITLPTLRGEITVLVNHVPLIAVLVSGEIKITKGDETFSLAVSGGFIEVLSEKVVVLADTAERSEEIDLERAEVAIKKAEELKHQRSVDSREFAMISTKIEKELVRLRVGRKKQRRVEQRGVGVKKYN